MARDDDEDEARRLARHFTPEAVETLVEIMKDRHNAAATRVTAATQIITISGITQRTTVAAATTSGGD